MDGDTSRGSGRRRALVILVAAVAMTLGSTQAELNYTAAPPGQAPSSQDFAVDCLAVGAAVNAPGQIEDRGLALFRDADQTLGPLTVRRSFDTSLPRSFDQSAGAGDAGVGVHSFVSWKPPRFDVRGVVAGKYDAEITAWAKSVPRTGVFATSFHEPENNMSAADFVAYQRHVYPVVKAANPTIQWGPVYMAYWWDRSQPSHFVGNPQAWFPGKNRSGAGEGPRPVDQAGRRLDRPAPTDPDVAALAGDRGDRRLADHRSGLAAGLARGGRVGLLRQGRPGQGQRRGPAGRVLVGMIAVVPAV
jgi:hypothetical protein